MAKKFQLKDRSGEKLYPLTTTDCVLDIGGGYLSDTLKDKANKNELSNVSAEEYIGDISAIVGVTREELKKDLFIDMWNKACILQYGAVTTQSTVGKYNEESGYFEANGLVDITYQEAIRIFLASLTMNWNSGKANEAAFTLNLRTLLVFGTGISQQSYTFDSTFYNSVYGNLKVIRLPQYFATHCSAILTRTFYSCRNLETIITPISPIGAIHNNTFYNCYALKNLKILNLASDINLKDSSVLTYDSLQYMVTNAANTTTITIKVHPTIFTKLTDPSQEDWYALNQLAISKNITFGT